MRRDQLYAHIAGQFSEPIFAEMVGRVKELCFQGQSDEELINQLHDEVDDIGDTYPQCDVYCVTLHCLRDQQLVTYDEWLKRINHP